MTEKTLQQLLTDREKAFLDATEHLIERIKPNVIAAVEERLTTQDKLGRGQTITWQQVVSVPSVNMLVILAVLDLPVGFKLTLESGDVFEVTEENAGYFSYPIRVGVPMDLAETGTKEQIAEFLEKQEREMEEAAHVASTKTVEAAKEALERALNPDPAELDLDTSILSEEQKKLFINLPPGSKPN